MNLVAGFLGDGVCVRGAQASGRLRQKVQLAQVRAIAEAVSTEQVNEVREGAAESVAHGLHVHVGWYVSSSGRANLVCEPQVRW